MTRTQRWTKQLTGLALTTLALVGCASTSSIPVRAIVVEAPITAADAHIVDSAWMSFRDSRDARLAEVAETLMACAKAKAREQSPECVTRRGTFEVAFGLSTLYRVTHDPTYLDAADAALDRRALGRLDRVDAYGQAHFLALATERQQTKRRTDLHDKAAEVAASLESWLSEADDYTFAQRTMFGNEENAALVLESLWDWAELNADDEQRTRLRQLTEQRFVAKDMDGWCPQTVDGEPENSEFLPPCLQRATAVLAVLPAEQSNPWLDGFLSAQANLEPVTLSRLSTHDVLNFSRAIALWRVYEATGDTRYRAKYVAHVDAGFARMKVRTEAGESIDPWQAAYAARALAMSVETTR